MPTTRAENVGSAGQSTQRRTAERASLPYLGALDGMRGIAIAAVVVYHTRFYLIQDRFPTPRGGFLGVDVFFVVSGFLITALLLIEDRRDDSISLVGFYWRRAVRLLPALVPMLGAYLLYASYAGVLNRDKVAAVAAALGFVSNWWRVLDGSNVPGLGHLWSLAVEEQFYLLWPAAVLLLIRRRRFEVAAALVVVAIAASMSWRMFLWSRADDWVLVYIRTDARIDQLLLGALVAVLWFHGRLPGRPAGLAWLGAAVIGIAFAVASPQSPVLYNGGFTVVAAATALVVVGCLGGHWDGAGLLNFGPLRQLGKVSYGLYLWHEPVLWATSREAGGLPVGVQVIIGVGLSILAAAVSWRLLETPALRQKNRFGRSSIDRGG
ncbi:MAG: acyltransferase [Acidimicrobiales bacterium]